MRSFVKSVLAFANFYFFIPKNPLSFSFKARTNARINVRIFIGCLFLVRALKSIDFILRNGYNINIPHFFFCNFNTQIVAEKSVKAHSLIFTAKDIIPLVGLYPIAFTNSFVVRCGRKKKCGSLSRGYILQCRLARGGIFFDGTIYKKGNTAKT